MRYLKPATIIICTLFGLLALYDIVLSEPRVDAQIRELNAQIEKSKQTFSYHDGIVSMLEFQKTELEKQIEVHTTEKVKANSIANKAREQIDLLLNKNKSESSIQHQSEATPPVSTNSGLDTERLCLAIAAHETASCTKGAGLTHNNCIGIKRNGAFVRYDTPDDSIADCVAVWSKYYKRFPDLRLAQIWSGNDRSDAWLANVQAFYYANGGKVD